MNSKKRISLSLGGALVVLTASSTTLADGVGQWFSEDVRLGVGAVYETSTYTQNEIWSGDVCCSSISVTESDYGWSLGLDVKIYEGLRFYAAGMGGYGNEYVVANTSQNYLFIDPSLPPPSPITTTERFTRTTDSAFEYGLRYEFEFDAFSPFISVGKSHHSYTYQYWSSVDRGDGTPPTISEGGRRSLGPQDASETTVGVGVLLFESMELEYKLGTDSDADFSQLSLMWKF
ncbi:hypothetical protein [Umboniibacter marinipuniceus]|uniref:Outer membrane protein with beta-barrel domain n=1 Tax=Umboniibacter marinipuniceus TaxID=569599 RepID=A0A3M0AU75_9GAMM|nr:hypothetical protein [Umboniibacter marinipuniceus]RMA82502.1 hypothetical protein DFR27_0452 [Umboniibacter marinipuniceus]